MHTNREALSYSIQHKEQVVIPRDHRTDIGFTMLLNQCILDAMKGLLGEGGAQHLLLHLQLVHYAQNSDEFHKDLRSILNRSSQVLERMIVEELFRRLDIPYHEKRAFDFERYIKQARAISIVRTK